jgi:aminopeptidase N
MSALHSSTRTVENLKEFDYDQPLACSSYLIAIAVGELEKVSCSRGRVLDDWVFSPTLLLQKKIFLSTT